MGDPIDVLQQRLTDEGIAYIQGYAGPHIGDNNGPTIGWDPDRLKYFLSQDPDRTFADLDAVIAYVKPFATPDPQP